MEDALVLTNDMDGQVKVGDKMEDLHGNKGVVSVILSQLTEEEIKEKHLEHAVRGDTLFHIRGPCVFIHKSLTVHLITDFRGDRVTKQGREDGDGREAPITDSQGRNVLPIRVGQDEVVPYRYTEPSP